MYDYVDEPSAGWEAEAAGPDAGAAWEPDDVIEPEAWTLEDLEDWLPAFAD